MLETSVRVSGNNALPKLLDNQLVNPGKVWFILTDGKSNWMQTQKLL